jgi:hypothetical protein
MHYIVWYGHFKSLLRQIAYFAKKDLVRQAIDFDHYYPTGKTPYFYRDHVGKNLLANVQRMFEADM